MAEIHQELQNPGSEPGVLLNSIQPEKQEARLTAVELGYLWNSYLSESLSHHIYVYFLKHMEDPLIKPFLTRWVDATRDSLQLLKSVLTKEGIPIPRGITSEDINLNAPRLFSDNFLIIMVKSMAKVALQFFSLAYAESSRRDIREFFRDFVDRMVMLNQQVADLKQTKGTPASPPHIPVPNKVDFVKKKSFLGNNRPLSTPEITRIFFNAQSNALGKALLMGYSQVVKSKEIKQFIIRGKNLSTKYYADLSRLLLDENITVPPSYDGEVTDSTESPFSDRFILNHSIYMGSIGLQFYGLALSMSPRHDLAAMYAKMMVETGTYTSDGAKLMIKNEWLEQPPLAPDRDALVRQGHKAQKVDHVN
ncbi:MAG: DUF3231 family protein [Desulfotomaculaceae bacterium]|nr:DUF3231 family protein [Desulfotomaculaceae bacterium]